MKRNEIVILNFKLTTYIKNVFLNYSMDYDANQRVEEDSKQVLDSIRVERSINHPIN
jgi:hypothetical protein